jgi:hypothetical protein
MERLREEDPRRDPSSDEEEEEEEQTLSGTGQGGVCGCVCAGAWAMLCWGHVLTSRPPSLPLHEELLTYASLLIHP